MPQEERESFFTELLKFVVIAAVIVLPVRIFVAQPFIVSGESMSPTFENGQYLIVDELTYRFNDPKRGDVVIFRYPRDPKEFFIKRIIGLPGETVVIAGGQVSVQTTSGATVALDEPYVKNAGNGRDTTYTVGTDEYFVMGDNRPESSDSRVWGVLPEDNLIGRALVRLLPATQIGLFPGHATYQE
jgi:signal peptidase I